MAKTKGRPVNNCQEITARDVVQGMCVLYSTVHPKTFFRHFLFFLFNFRVVHSPSPHISQDKHTDSAQAREQSSEARDQRLGTNEGVGEESIRQA
jgi:hypothetical protein